MTPNPTHIYHITHGSNLAAIIAGGGLQSYSLLHRISGHYTDIAYGHIQDRRHTTPVPCGPRGLLHDYVPFYFGPRSPMLLAIHRGNVEGYTGGQKPVLHLVSTVQAVMGAQVPFVFTDGHAVVALTKFFDHVSGLEAVDWPLMSERYWADTPEDGDRKRRRQAEFLVHASFPWELVQGIGVLDETVKARVEQDLGAANHRPAVFVRRDWYY